MIVTKMIWTVFALLFIEENSKTKRGQYGLTSIDFFGLFLGTLVKNVKYEKVPRIVFLRLTCLAKKLKVPIWVLKMHSHRKLILLCKTT